MTGAATLYFPRSMADRILAWARASPSVEVCGLVGARAGRAESWYPVDNIDPEPHWRFRMDPAQQIAAMKTMRERGEELFAIVHSHPHSPAVPSAIDLEEIGYPDAYCMIVSLQNRQTPELRCFRPGSNKMQELQLACEDST